MRSSGPAGSGKRPIDRAQTDPAQRDHGRGAKRLFIVGLGPGGLAHLSPRAHDVLASADTIVGYTTYIDLIRPLVAGKTLVSTGMTREVDRADAAIAAALEGRTTAVVSSGDAGIYAMAGLILELCRRRNLPLAAAGSVRAGDLQIEVVPGIPALAAGAALLGAPLTHDFAVVSLSDLLTPWDTIARRLDAVARADFVIVIYNPKSKRRPDHLQRACEIMLGHRPAETPAGVVRAATRPQESVQITTLGHLAQAEVDMQTILFVGNTATEIYDGFMITPRGYARKYDLGGSQTPP